MSTGVDNINIRKLRTATSGKSAVAYGKNKIYAQMSTWLQGKLKSKKDPHNVFKNFQQLYGDRIEKSIKKYKGQTVQKNMENQKSQKIKMTQELESVYRNLQKKSKNYGKTSLAFKNKNSRNNRNGSNDQPNGINDRPNGINDRPNGINDRPNGINDRPNGSNAQLNSRNVQLNGSNAQLNSRNVQLNSRKTKKIWRLESFTGSELIIPIVTNNKMPKFKKTITELMRIDISGFANQCYARTTLLVLLLYINRSIESFDEFMKIAKRSFEYENIPFLWGKEYWDNILLKLINQVMNEENNKYVSPILRKFNINIGDKFRDVEKNETYKILNIDNKWFTIKNNVKNAPWDILLVCKHGNKLVEIKLGEYLAEKYEKISGDERNKVANEKIDKINKIMRKYYDKPKNKKETIDVLGKIYNNAKLFNNSNENKILREFIKHLYLKILIDRGEIYDEIIDKIQHFFSGKPFVVFIKDFMSMEYFKNLTYYNYNQESLQKTVTLVAQDKSVTINQMNDQVFNKNSPVLVGNSKHQEVAVNEDFFRMLNNNEWPKYTI